VVTMFRMKNGAWARVAVRRPFLSGTSDIDRDGFSDSRFSTRFPRPRRGLCRIVARFRGDTDHGPSQATKSIRC
jgi:hypothetical protein